MRNLVNKIIIAVLIFLLIGEPGAVILHQVYLPFITKPVTIRVFDANGVERDLAWAKEKYNVFIQVASCTGEKRWAIVEIREVIGPSSLMVYLTELIAGIPIAFSWPDAPQLSLPSEPKPRKLVKLTNERGQAGIGMGAYYRPWLGECGPYAVWVSLYPKDTSDMVDCLGMVAGTFHNHLEPVFKSVKCY